MARRRFFVDEVISGRARLAGKDARHLARVLRVQAGQRYEISNGSAVYLAEIESVQKDLVTFTVIDQLKCEKPLLRPYIYVSLVRFERFEWMLEKATELGAFRVIAVQAERSEKGLERAASSRMERWQRIVREASEQSRRASVPELDGPVRLSEAIASGSDQRFALDEDPSATPVLQALPVCKSPQAEISLLFGPEGGWTERERGAITAADWKPVSLGHSILKTETAVLAALAIINAAWQAES